MGIVTITANPCVDKSTVAPYLKPDKKLRCENPVFEPGGGGINVCRAIKKLGGSAIPVLPAGGHTGQFLLELLKKEGINPIVVDTKEITRENFIVVDKSSGNQYRFGMPGPAVSKEEVAKILDAIEGLNDTEYMVVSGSLTTGIDDSFIAGIAGIAARKNAKLVVDSSGEALKKALDEKIFLCKPNLGELASLAGEEELSQERAIETAGQIIARGKCEIIVISMGAAGAAMVTKSEVKIISAPVVKRKSTVGAGDSMIAGIVLSLSKGMEPHQAV
ncbi:MAG: 1-phosphofructokinase family hexose kinase, partial [Gemmatimonadaceae bacterium]|nr:1-phosphofructokinase family hexose kinase [Chitinophagaceae bacterium]